MTADIFKVTGQTSRSRWVSGCRRNLMNRLAAGPSLHFLLPEPEIVLRVPVIDLAEPQKGLEQTLHEYFYTITKNN